MAETNHEPDLLVKEMKKLAQLAPEQFTDETGQPISPLAGIQFLSNLYEEQQQVIESIVNRCSEAPYANDFLATYLGFLRQGVTPLSALILVGMEQSRLKREAEDALTIEETRELSESMESLDAMIENWQVDFMAWLETYGQNPYVDKESVERRLSRLNDIREGVTVS